MSALVEAAAAGWWSPILWAGQHQRARLLLLLEGIGARLHENRRPAAQATTLSQQCSFAELHRARSRCWKVIAACDPPQSIP